MEQKRDLNLDLIRCTALPMVPTMHGLDHVDIYSVTLPATVTEIRASAFEDCGNLEQVTLPNGVTTIGVAAFKNCNYLRNMTTFD